jgi:hypothetical protein
MRHKIGRVNYKRRSAKNTIKVMQALPTPPAAP